MQLANVVAQIELLNENSTGANFRCTACILQHTEAQTKIRMVAEDKGHIICLSCLNCARNYSFAISKIFFKPAKSRSLS